MNKRILKTGTSMIAFCLVFVSPIILAQSEDTPVPVEIEKSHYEEDVPVSDIAAELGLTEEQKEQLKEQRFQSNYKKIQTRSKTRLKELELRHELQKKEVDREAIDRILKELKELQAAALDQKVESILRVKEILTPEQFEKLNYLGRRRIKKGLGKMKEGCLGRMKEKFKE
jgi:Spy/CpxP family protein refolding chaperone